MFASIARFQHWTIMGSPLMSWYFSARISGPPSMGTPMPLNNEEMNTMTTRKIWKPTPMAA